jgi:hypothetical protein
VSSGTTDEQRLQDLARLRRAKDPIDPECAPPLGGAALARGPHMWAGLLTPAFKRGYGE